MNNLHEVLVTFEQIHHYKLTFKLNIQQAYTLYTGGYIVDLNVSISLDHRTENVVGILSA